MIRRLQIENFGLIETAGVEFGPGATIFTGETGSGKTMVLGALAFALGERAAADVVRRGASKAVVTLSFSPSPALSQRLAGDGFPLDPGEDATIVREMTQTGRSAVRVNGRPSTAGYVRELGDDVAELVGQHEAQRLLSPAFHLRVLDRFAGEPAAAAVARVAAAHLTAERLAQELADLHAGEELARRRYDDARFAVREIDDANLERGEDERLDARRRFLDNVERIATALRRAQTALAEDDGGATSALGAAHAALAGVGDLNAGLSEMAVATLALQEETNDLAARIAGALEATEFDPQELETINERLETIDRLKRKYGASIDEILAERERLAPAVESFENRDRRAEELGAAVAAAGRELAAAAAKLTALREKAAVALAKRVRGELADLALGSAAFDVALLPLERIGAAGAERVEFRFAANAGEALRALGRGASGGELSRVLLALVVCLSGSAYGGEETLVFDEIDAGIGGATATAVGARIGRLAAATQVVCVTHLAQIATWARQHYVLDKREEAGQTTIAVRELANAAEREREIARMLSGESHDAALAHARQMLRAAGFAAHGGAA